MPLSVFLSSLFLFYLVQTTWNPFQDIYPNTLGRLVLRRTVVVLEALQMNLISPYYQFEENYLFLAEQDCVFKSRVLHSASCHFTMTVHSYQCLSILGYYRGGVLKQSQEIFDDNDKNVQM